MPSQERKLKLYIFCVFLSLRVRNLSKSQANLLEKWSQLLPLFMSCVLRFYGPFGKFIRLSYRLGGWLAPHVIYLASKCTFLYLVTLANFFRLTSSTAMQYFFFFGMVIDDGLSFWPFQTFFPWNLRCDSHFIIVGRLTKNCLFWRWQLLRGEYEMGVAWGHFLEKWVFGRGKNAPTPRPFCFHEKCKIKKLRIWNVAISIFVQISCSIWNKWL